MSDDKPDEGSGARARPVPSADGFWWRMVDGQRQPVAVNVDSVEGSLLWWRIGAGGPLYVVDDGLWISPMGDGPPDPVVPWQEYRPGMILRPLDGRPPRYLLSEVRADGLGIVYIIRDKYGTTCCKRTTLALWVVEPVVLP